MADLANNPVTRLIRRAPAARRVANPVLAQYLEDLAKADRLAAQWDASAAAAARLRPGSLDDGLIPPPRGPLDPADLGAAIESAMPQRGYEVPFADQLLANDRTRALVGSRLDRLTPEQQASSLPFVGRQAEWDARMASRQQRESTMDLPTRMGLAGMAATLGTAGYMKTAEDARRAEEEAAAELAAEELLRQQMAEAIETDGNFSMPMSIDIGDEPLIDVSGVSPEMEEGDYSYMGLPLADIADLMQEDQQVVLGPAEPDVQAYSPPVAVEEAPLPGPKARSIQALMRAGIAEPRARDIILKGYSMSPDEYRAVTGGRR